LPSRIFSARRGKGEKGGHETFIADGNLKKTPCKFVTRKIKKSNVQTKPRSCKWPCFYVMKKEEKKKGRRECCLAFVRVQLNEFLRRGKKKKKALNKPSAPFPQKKGGEKGKGERKFPINHN